MHLGLGVFWAVVISLGIAVLVFAVLVLASYYNTNKTKKKVLREMFLKIQGDPPVICDASLIVKLYPEKEDLLLLFKNLFFFLSLEELKKLKITKLDEDVYNMWQDVDDLRREVIEKKQKREQQAW
jgi:hypothetical protein